MTTPAPPDEIVESVEIVPDVAHHLYREAVRQNRREWVMTVPVMALAIVAVYVAAVLPAFRGSLLLVGVFIVVRVGRLAVHTWRLRSDDAFTHRRRDLQEERAAAVQTAQLAEHSVRAAAVTPVATYALMAAICFITFVEFVTGVRSAVALAGLVKPAVWAGEWWRMLTASYLHGSGLHLFGNMAGLLLLGKMIETYDRRLRVPLVYLLAVIGGSIASTLLLAKPSIGASGGIMGLAGYLFILGTRQPAGAPDWIRQHMLRIFASVAITGVVGFFFIDNAGHIGGVLAGLLVGALVIPGRGAPPADGTQGVDVLGWIASATLAGGAVFTLARLTHR